MKTPFEIVFNVPMECDSCVSSVESAAKELDGVEKASANLKLQVLTVSGFLPPSDIVRAMQKIGKDAIVRGTGKPNSAAVCILESFEPEDNETPVKGLARIVAVSEKDIYVDLTVDGVPKGTYYPLIRNSGNLSRGALSTGSAFHEFQAVTVDKPSSGQTNIKSLGAAATSGLFAHQSFLHAPLTVESLIGRSMVLSDSPNVTEKALCGVIARSAGAWENNKEVCSCTGKTVWQERQDAANRGAVL